MYIKRIVIQGFKSYKNQTIAGPFSPHHNVVVGRNGSGKSNFFAAIRFVLGDAFKTLGKEDRTQLLHDGAGTSVMSAYVEIVFDNEDGRIMGRGDEVVVRRTVGLKKDEYSLDKKSSSKQEVANLLETAGFSPSNPYYIVPQGKVTSLTNARDTERLKLLKEVAGTEVYETKRTRSLGLMEETKTKREQIDETLKGIRAQMDDLERETRVLKDFQEKDKVKRCLDYTILQRELEDVNAKLESIEAEMVDGADDNTAQTERLYQLEENANRLESNIAELKERINTVEFEKQQAENDLQEAISDHARAELEAGQYENSRAAASQDREHASSELKSVDAEIKSKGQELKNVDRQYSRLKANEMEVRAQLNTHVTRKTHLQVKQGRSAKFSNKKEHDTWHKFEIQSLQETISKRQNALENDEKDLEDINTQHSEALQKIAEIKENLETVQQHKRELKQKEAEFSRRETELNDQKKELWREQNSLHSRLESAKTSLKVAEQKLGETMARDLSQGLKSVQRIAKRMNLSGVHGMLAELIAFDDKYKTAVEVTAGTSLFHVVVDTDDTATKIMEELKRERGGRVTFVPLNRLDKSRLDYPEADGTIPLVHKLKFKEEYTAVITQVFGRAIVCKTLEIGQQVAQPNGFNAITLQGDRLDNQGVLTGGYTDTRRSRMDATRRVKEARQDVEEREAEYAECNRQVQRKDQEITLLLNERSRALSGNRQMDYESLNSELMSMTRHSVQLTRLREQKSSGVEDKRSDLSNLEEQVRSHEQDLAAGFTKTLTDTEQQELENCRAQIPQLQSQANELETQISETIALKSNLEFALNETLASRRAQLISQISQIEDESTGTGRQNDLQDKLQSLQRRKDQISGLVKQHEQELEEVDKQISGFQDSLASIQEEQLNVGRLLERQRKRMDSRMARKAEVVQRKENLNARIRELGVIPEDAWGKYKNMSSNEIAAKNRELGEELKGYSYVNKKALEQYNAFHDRREELDKRREELVESEDSITDLIDTLDQRKDEAIGQTFRRVSKSFTEVFKKLVPRGAGKLIMQRRSEDAAASQSQTSQIQQTQTIRDDAAIESYTGVAISVSFNSEHDEQLRIEQLSGGQKSLCALALIFAIQMCDPAPFYLFDEVDANLDTQYRTAVADMIRELSRSGGQFVCTTFRPEMVNVATAFFGVSFKDSMSSVAQISKEQAAEFIDGANRA